MRFEYRSTPFAVGGVPTALAEAEGFIGELPGLWVAREGVIERVVQRADGSMDIADTITLAPGVAPVAISEARPRFFVLDRAGGLLIYELSDGKGYQLVRTLATGAQPSGMVASDESVAIANAGSNDVSLYTWSGDAVSPERRIAVGARPRALVSGEFMHSADLAIANEGSGSLSFIARGSRADAPAEPHVVAETPIGGRQAPIDGHSAAAVPRPARALRGTPVRS